MSNIGKLDKKEIDRLKSKHGSVYCIKVDDDEGNVHHCYVRKPDLNVISAAAKYAESDPIKSGLIMYNSVKLETTEGIEADDEMKMAVIAKIGGIFKIRAAELEKL